MIHYKLNDDINQLIIIMNISKQKRLWTRKNFIHVQFRKNTITKFIEGYGIEIKRLITRLKEIVGLGDRN